MSATIKDVAERAGVSIATVSNVVNGSRFVSDDLAEKVRQAIVELGYQPNPLGRALRKGKSFTIALILPDHSNPFFVQVARGVEEQARRREYGVITCNTDEDPELETFYIASLLKRKVDGFIVSPTFRGGETLQPLIAHGAPLVVVDRYIDGMKVDEVFSDNEGGAYEATEHLVSLGHRRIGLLVGIPGISSIEDRVAGYKRALAEHGIPEDESLIGQGCSQIKEGASSTESLLKQRGITAIFSTNNMMTLGALQCFKNRGIRCPDDVSLIGFDDSEWASAFTPSLTVVAQQSYEMGYSAGDLLFEAIARGKGEHKTRAIKLQTVLISRESTGRPSEPRPRKEVHRSATSGEKKKQSPSTKSGTRRPSR
jgi:DNA-binding LacI/PurR family transcriptional regulator